jgi:hypothetical protein
VETVVWHLSGDTTVLVVNCGHRWGLVDGTKGLVCLLFNTLLRYTGVLNNVFFRYVSGL